MLHHTVYDHSGLRKTKVVNGQTTQYEYEGGKLITETRSDGRKLYFQYSGDTLIGFDLLENGNTYSYFYKRDAKGEIVGMLDFWGTKVASYYYDAYGQVVSMKDHGGNEVKDASTHLGNLNPFKFKAYYYDYEAKWYYLQSRYYAPGVCRFLNADAIIQRTSLTGTNMFAYCNSQGNLYKYEDFWFLPYRLIKIDKNQIDIIYKMPIFIFVLQSILLIAIIVFFVTLLYLVLYLSGRFNRIKRM